MEQLTTFDWIFLAIFNIVCIALFVFIRKDELYIKKYGIEKFMENELKNRIKYSIITFVVVMLFLSVSNIILNF